LGPYAPWFQASMKLSEMTGSPLLKVKPGLSLTVHTLLSSEVMDSAAVSTGSFCSLNFTSG
jgi:hypothetical protein